jgi:hypothetical protein
MVIVLDAAFSFIFKKRYCFQHDLPGWLVKMFKLGIAGIQQFHKYPFVQMAVVNTVRGDVWACFKQAMSLYRLLRNNPRIINRKDQKSEV